MEEQDIKVLQVRGITFTVKGNKQLFAIGNGYISSTVDARKKLLSCDTERLVEYCIKNITYSEEVNCLSLYDTQDRGYDVFIHDNIAYKCSSFVQSDTGKKCLVGAACFITAAIVTYAVTRCRCV